MKNLLFKFKTLFLALLAISSTLSATQRSCGQLTQDTSACYFSKPLLEFKTGCFFFSHSKMRKIYDKGGLDVQLSATYPLWNLTSRWNLNGYTAVEYFQRSGQSLNEHQKTSVWSVPINIGIKPIYAINANTQYYFAIGPRYFYIHQHNQSSYVYKNKSKNGLGFFVNMGLSYSLSNHFVIDISGEYSYAKMHLEGEESCIYTPNIQMGGFILGVGVGYKF